MVGQGIVSGVFPGNRKFTGRCDFYQGISGAGLQVVKDSQVWYVDKYKTSPAISGDGLTWDTAFLTIAEAITAAGAYDTILIGAGTYAEKLTITQYGLKMFGAMASSGDQSFTTISAILASAAPCLTITTKGKQEIAGINFQQAGAKAAVQLGESGGSGIYSIHIHDCRFDGTGVGLYGVSNYAASNPEDCPDLVVENCQFREFVTAAIYANSTRDVYRNNLIWVRAAGIGIDYVPTTGDRPDGLIENNRIVGSNSTDTGIKITGTPTAGTYFIVRNIIANCNTLLTSKTNNDAVCVNNYSGDSAGGALVDPST